MSRPAGVTLLGALFILIGLLQIISGAYMFIVAPATLISFFYSGMISAIAISVIIFGIVFIIIAWGLLSLKRWARILAIVLALFTLLSGLISLIAFPIGTIAGIIYIIMSIIILWYLFKPEVASAFELSQK